MAPPVSSSADRWLATLAGRNTWQESEGGLNAASRALAALQAVSVFGAVSSVLLIGYELARDSTAERFVAPATVLTLVGSLAIVGATRTALGAGSPARSAAVNVLLRALLGILATASIFAIAPRWWSLLSWPIGVAVGCDTAMSAAAIGWRPSPREWWTSVLLSPFHAGIIGGLVGASLARDDVTAVGTVVPIYVTLQVWLVIACITAWSSQRILDIDAATRAAIRTDTMHDEHRRSAHWLHDDICAQLRLVSLKVQGGGLSMAEVGELLDDLDFALRLRQLDELIESGTVRLAELLQPFLRKAQNHGVSVQRVPTYDTASTEVDHDAAVAFRRAAAVLTSNALNAGATQLSVDVAVFDEVIDLTVTDDAGGFDPSQLSAGRGLWSLRQDLGPQHLTVDRFESGSRVRASIPRRVRSSNGTPVTG
jgi:signal transduction histidine kinase